MVDRCWGSRSDVSEKQQIQRVGKRFPIWARIHFITVSYCIYLKVLWWCPLLNFLSPDWCRGGPVLFGPRCFRLWMEGLGWRIWSEANSFLESWLDHNWGQNHLIRTKKQLNDLDMIYLLDALSLKKLFLVEWVAGHVVRAAQFLGWCLLAAFLMVWWMIASHPNKMHRKGWWINLSCLHPRFCTRLPSNDILKADQQSLGVSFFASGFCQWISGLVYYQTTHDVMALQPAEKELQEGRPLQELPPWLLPRLVSTGVFSEDEINQVCLRDEWTLPKLKWKLNMMSNSAVCCIWSFHELFS